MNTLRTKFLGLKIWPTFRETSWCIVICLRILLDPSESVSPLAHEFGILVVHSLIVYPCPFIWSFQEFDHFSLLAPLVCCISLWWFQYICVVNANQTVCFLEGGFFFSPNERYESSVTANGVGPGHYGISNSNEAAGWKIIEFDRKSREPSTGLSAQQ